MFLAPLNYDRFFKKIFSDNNIAKAFLEDFLDVEIEEIQQLGNEHAITNRSKIVEFDYRCKINGQYVIIDMQQWYKSDIAQRFYIYHALNSALQLEDLKEKIVKVDLGVIKNGELETVEKEVKDYRKVDPVLTLVWLVDDSLHFENDFISYKLLPELIESFVKNKQIWFKENFKNLLNERKKIIEIVDSEHKDMDFLKKNKLIFMFQKNIVNNFEIAKKKAKKENIKANDVKYVRWFDFAKKTLKKDNSEKDFEEYQKDELFKEIMRRLQQEKLSKKDKNYLKDESNFREKVNAYNEGVFSDGLKEGHLLSKKEIKKANQKAEIAEKKAELAENKAEEEKRKAELAEKKAEESKTNMILELNKNNVPLDVIAAGAQLSENEVIKILSDNK